MECIDRPVEGYGKTFAKMVGINPDTVMQMAIQLAYYSVHRWYVVFIVYFFKNSQYKDEGKDFQLV